jgi:hypothetical protein
MIAQGLLPFKYEEERLGFGLTGLGGLPTYLELAHASGMWGSIDRHMRIRGGQGWRDSDVVMTLVMLNLAGGECVEDVNRLEADEGFCRVWEKARKSGLNRRRRREERKRWRKEKVRGVPSPSAIFRYLEGFHEGSLREGGKALVPAADKNLMGLREVNGELLGFVQSNRREKVATLDMDATLVETRKSEALFCYEGYRAYQPLTTWWSEQGVVVHTEFRDGNVPAGYEQLRVLKESLRCLPEGVKRVRLRSDTAGYQHDLMRFCEEGKDTGFGKIGFTIGCDVSKEFKKAVGEVEEEEWKVLCREEDGRRVETRREFAEVCFVPYAIGHSNKGPEYRYIAIREPMEEQLSLGGMEEEREYPFQTMRVAARKYKLFGLVTNMDWDGQELIPWHYKRCGKSEEAHSVMKEDLAGGKFPSGDFGENAAWWWIMVLAMNLNAAMKALVLGKEWVAKRMKAIRFHLIHLPARVIERSRQLFIRMGKGHPSYQWLTRIRCTIANLAPCASG